MLGMCVLSCVNTIRVSELGPERLGLGRFAGQRGFAGCACNSRNKEMPPICPFSVGYHPLLSDSADDGVDCLAARPAARSALAQLHS